MQPPRHGLGGFSTIPVRTGVGSAAGKGRQLIGQQSIMDVEHTPPVAGVLSAKMRDVFLTAMPSPNIGQIARHDAIYYNPTTAIAGAKLSITGLNVPEGMVYIITDVQFFAMIPSPVLAGASQMLDTAALAGLLRFELSFGGHQPAQLEGNFVSPLAGTTRDLNVRSGWPFLNRPFGAERVTAFGMYARSGLIKATATVDVVPEFPITMLGVELAGVSLAQNTFSSIWAGQGV